MSVAKTNAPAEYILANYFLSMIYRIYGELGWRAINLQYAGVVSAMENLSSGQDLRFEPPGSANGKLKEERLASYMKWLLFTRSRKRTDQYDARIRREADDFIAAHKALMAELALTTPVRARAGSAQSLQGAYILLPGL